MTTALSIAGTRRTVPPVRKFLAAASLILGLAVLVQPVVANARGFGGGGHGFGGRGCCGGFGFSVGLYAPFYAWGPYPYGYYGYPYPYYYDPAVIAPVNYPDVVWPQSAPAYNQQAYAQALSAPIGQEIAFSDGGMSGTITSVRDGHSGNRYCREFLQKVVIDGRHQQVYGAACQTPDGRWQIVPDNP